MQTFSISMRSRLVRTLRGALILGGWTVFAACGAELGTSNQAVAAAAAGEQCVVNGDCAAGLECEHGACQAHGGAGGGEAEPGDDNGDDSAGNPACLVDSDCASGLECDDGACKSHGGH